MRSLFFISLVACNTAPSMDRAPGDPARAWGDSDRPSLMGDDLVADLAALPTKGAAEKIPWASSYWPTYQDSVNHRWAGEDSKSPTEKYAEAFGIEGLTDRISKQYGIDSIAGTECTETADCNKDHGETCAKRTGEETGTCIETWFGICHAWAPAAIMVDEPQQAVIYNGVTFEPTDLAALASLSFDTGLQNSFMSLRCDKRADGEEWKLDAYGNPIEKGCADTNPGSLHIVLANLVGLQGQSLVEDRTYDYEVWNQPIRGFEVKSMKTVEAGEASRLAGDTSGGDAYAFNDEAKGFRHVTMTLDYISESASDAPSPHGAHIDRYTRSDTYQYILELDTSGAIIGGEWIGDSKKSHPDFLWQPTAKTEATVGADGGKPGIAWSDVSALVAKSTEGTGADGGGFDWGSACEPGEGSFESPIPYRETTDIGTIPDDKADVRVQLSAKVDIDIQLIDVATGTEIVAWPDGMLNGSGEACTEFDGTTVCYSGYDGDGDGAPGNEWIEVRGPTKRALQMRAYGYQAGDAAVTYSYAPLPGCVDEGEGSFSQEVRKSDVLPVGILPAGKTNLSVHLSSSADVDLMLVDGATILVGWPDGLLKGAGKSSIDYEGATITWSGYNGVDGKLGNEYIIVEGELKSDLILKAFGYAAGSAEVNYSWGRPIAL
jgi:hypothetical protein